MSSTRSTIAPPVFASDATTTIPPTPIAGVSYRDPIAGPASAADGWPYAERVNSAEFNQILFQMTTLLSIMDKKGVLGWSSAVDYTEPGIAFGSDGLVYLWLLASGPNNGGAKDPISNPTYWIPFNSGSMIGAPKVLTTSQTYIPSPGTKSIIAEFVGGGGGSSFTPETGAAQWVTTGGAQAGAYAKARFTIDQIAGGIAVTIGAAGVGGNAEGTIPSTSGSATSFGALLSVSGGARSLAGAVVSSSTTMLSVPAVALATITGASIIVQKPGEPGTWGVSSAGGDQLGGSGGSSPLGSGGPGAGNTVIANPGAGYGGGGGGGSNGPSTAAKAGANGSPGVAIIWEFY